MKKLCLLLIYIALICNAKSQNPSLDYKNQELNQVNKLLTNKSLEFVENKGQLADSNGKPMPEILYYAHAPGMKIYVRNGGISIILSKNSFNSAVKTNSIFNNLPNNQFPTPSTVEYYRTDMNFTGKVNKPVITGIEPTCAFNNYYLTQCPLGILNVRIYQGIKYENIYPNIDFVLYVNENNQPEYDFVIKPGGDPNNIGMQIYPFEKLSITENGSIEITTSLGVIEKMKPAASQMTNNTKNEIGTCFKLSADGYLSFKIDSYDSNRTLTIDPMIRVWGTYFGGSTEDYCRDMTIDSQNNLYLVGYTNSIDVIGSGGYQSTKGYDYDAFVAKFDNNGNRLWSTYYGGNSSDFGNSIDIYNNLIYIAGRTASTNVMGNGGYQPILSRDSIGGLTYDAFFTKFDSNGQRIWSSYYGGNNFDAATDIILDKVGNIYLCGTTTSTDVIGTGGFQPNLYPSYDSYGFIQNDAFIVKFSNDGSVREWGTYFGGNGADGTSSLAVDSIQNVYITGSTSSTNIMGVGGYQSSISLKYDGFISKFSSIGNKVWSTYYGGNANDYPYKIVLDKKANLYIVGETVSTDVIGVGGYQSIHGSDNNDFDGFLTKFNNNGYRVWGTYYGGNSWDRPKDIKLDLSGNIYIAGTSASTNVIGVGGYQEIMGGSQNAFFAIFDTSGQRKYGSYYGGNNVDLALAIAFDSYHNIYLAGYTNSTNVIGDGGYQSNFGGSVDAFLVKFKAISQSITTSYSGGTDLCSGSHIRISFSKNGVFNKGNYFNAELSNTSGSFSLPVIIGSQTDTTLNYIDAKIPAGQAYSKYYRLRVSSTNPYVPGSNNGNDIRVTRTPSKPTIIYVANILRSDTSTGNQWYNDNSAISGATAWTYTPVKSGLYYDIVTINGCSSDTSNKINVIKNDIEENSKINNLKIYPNPFTNELIIELTQPNGNANVSIFNMQGVEIIHSKLSSLQNIIKTGNIPNGIYLLKFQTKDKIEIFKIVKE